MKKLTPQELDKRKAAARVRALARVQTNEAYLDLINEIAPEAELRLEAAFQRGKRLEPLDLLKTLKLEARKAAKVQTVKILKALTPGE